MIKLDGVDMSEVEEEFDKLLENHVTCHQGALRMEFDNNNFSEKFVQTGGNAVKKFQDSTV